MLKSDSAKKIHLTSVDDIFGIPDESKTASSTEGVREIPLSDLYTFKGHPFQVRDDAEMDKLVESIKNNGVLAPALARPRAEGGYELISGHRRKHGCELAGLHTMPVVIKELDDDQATIVMVDSNLQRETLLPSERAFGYKMKLEAMKRQGKRTDLTSSQLGTKLNNNIRTDQILAEQVGESRNQVQRYVRLTELVPDLLKMVDNKKVAFNPAVELSYLSRDEQLMLLQVIEKESAPSLSQAQRLKQFSQEGKLNESSIEAIMTEEKPGPKKLTFSGSQLKKYFPSSYTSAQMESVILSLLKNWSESKERTVDGE